MKSALWIAVTGFLAGVAALAPKEGGESLLSPAEIERGLADHPPLLGDREGKRKPFIEALDAWVQRPDTIYWDGKAETAHREFFAFYLRGIERALAEAEKTTVPSGAVVWKLYSSGFLVKTPTATFAFDVSEGPFKSITSKPEDQPGYFFHWTPAMRQRLAKMVDVFFITHQHYDHLSYALVREVGAAGKTIVVPPDLRDLWRKEPFADRLMSLKPDVDHRQGPLTVRVFQAVQAMKKNDDGDWVVSDSDPQHYVYLVRDQAGTGFLHNGDNRGRPFLPWLKQALADGWKLHVWFRIFGWPSTVIQDVEKLADPVIIPGHNHEVGHKPKYTPSLLGGFYNSMVVGRADKKRYAVLAWGERLTLDQTSLPGK